MIKTHFTTASLLLLLFFVLHTPIVHAYPSHRIALPNGEYIETNEDLKVKVMGGYIIAKREWTNSRWYLTSEWADLKFTYDDLDNSVKAIDRAGAIYERNGEAWFLETKYRIQKTAVGYRWSDNQGAWATYGDEGKITAVGDRNLTRAVFTYDAGGRRGEVKDAHGNLALKFTYDAAGLLQTVEDRAGRQVHYHYSGDRLTRVTDVLGNEWKYTYDSHGQIQTRTDPEGNVIQLFYVDPNPAGKAEGSGFSASAKTKAQSAAYGYTGKPLRDVKTARVGTYTDAEGNVTTYQYQYNRQTRKYTVTQISPLGTRTTTIYDKNGRVLQNTIGSLTTSSVIRESDKVEAIIDARGLITKHTYDGNRNILKIVYPDGSSVHNTYDPYDQLLTRTDELGIITKYEYDAKGNLTRLTEATGLPEQRITEHSYDPYGQRTKTVLKGDSEADDMVTQWKYDNYGNINEETDAEGHTTKYNYNVAGDILTITDPRGAITEYQYDKASNLLITTEAKDKPEARTSTATYDKVRNRTSETDARGFTTLYAYDKSGRLLQTKDPLGGIETIEYDRDGHLIKQTDKDGVYTRITYNSEGLPVEGKDPLGNMITTIYGTPESGLTGLVVAIQYPTYKEEYRYDPRNRLVLIIRSLDEQTKEMTRMEYDAAGNLVKEIDALGRISESTYDAHRQTIRTVDTLGKQTVFKYNRAQELIEIIDAQGSATKYEYDKLSNLLKETRPLGEIVQCAYDENSNLIELKSASGRKSIYVYNLLNQLIKEEHYLPGQTAPERIITYTHDAESNLTTYVDQENNKTISSGSYEYDANGQMTKQTINYGDFSKTHAFAYTAAGRLQQRADPDNVGERYIWNSNGDISEIILNENHTIKARDYQWAYPQTIEWPNSLKQENVYDPVQRIKGQKITKGTEAILNRIYHYNLVNNITQIVKEGKATNYGYDALNRLISVTVPDNGVVSSESYTYDAVGNRLQDGKGRKYAYNANQQLIRIENGEAVRNFAYNEDGHLNKEIAGGVERNFNYNAEQRLTEIKENDNPIARYTYDPFGRRIKKETGGKTIWFGYDDTGLIAEYDETGTQLAAYGYWSGEKWQADPLYKRENTTYFFYHNDHLGTPQRLTNQQGEISWSADYEAFGAAKETVTVTSNPHRFPGQYHDEEVTLSQNYFRTYDPNLGRYLEFDPLYQESIDPYGYARNNPLRYTDPTGEIAPLAGMYARCVLQCAGMTCLMGFVSGDGCNPCADAPDCLLDCLNPLNWGPKKLPAAKKPKSPPQPCYIPPPKGKLTGFPNATRMGERGGRESWKLGDGTRGSWDYQHGEVERYSRNRRHMGGYDPYTGAQTSPPVKGRPCPKGLF